jgi:hypothetical protein
MKNLMLAAIAALGPDGCACALFILSRACILLSRSIGERGRRRLRRAGSLSSPLLRAESLVHACSRMTDDSALLHIEHLAYAE